MRVVMAGFQVSCRADVRVLVHGRRRMLMRLPVGKRVSKVQ